MKNNDPGRAPFYGMLALIFATAVGGFLAFEATKSIVQTPSIKIAQPKP